MKSHEVKKALRLFFVIAFAISAGCHRNPKPAAAPVASVAETPQPAPTPVPVTPVPPPSTDFAPPPARTSEVLSSDIAELNRVVRDRGWIVDAFFDFDRYALSASAQDALARSGQWLRDHPEYAISVEGHCDERGTEQYNLALGERRADSARTYLETLGIDASRVTIVSYGEERPFDPGHNEQAWASNRRAHLVLQRGPKTSP